MNYKQALAVLSDFLMKCEEEGVALPSDPLDAVIAAIHALAQEAKHEIGRRQMEAALTHMKQQCGVVQHESGSSASKAPAKPLSPKRMKVDKQREEEESPSEEDQQEGEKGEEEKVVGSTGSGQPTLALTPEKTLKATTPPAKLKPTKLHNEIASKPAKCATNQALVDQLTQLGDYEMKHGHTQRGVARLRAAKEVRDAAEAITSGAQARKLDRVGQSAAAKIDAILHGGLENALREYTSD